MPARTRLGQRRLRGSRLPIADDMPAWLPLSWQQQWLGGDSVLVGGASAPPPGGYQIRQASKWRRSSCSH